MKERVPGNVEPTPPDSARPQPEPGAAPALRLVRNTEPAHAPSSVSPHPASTSLSMPTQANVADDAAELSPALEDVVRRFGNFMRRTGHRHNLAASEIEDVVQETRIRLWKALGTSTRIREAPASYIYRTVSSAALDFLRRRRARREESIESFGESAATTFAASNTADDTLRQSEVSRTVVRAVELLVESRRAVVRMYLSGYDREEIAELLGWSEAKTRNLLYRGLADVRASLESWGYGPGGTE